MATEKKLPGFSWFIEGKLAGMAMPYAPERVAQGLDELGIGAVVSLTRRPLPRSALEGHGMEHLHLPIADFAPPSQEQVKQFVDFCDTHIRQDRAVVVHCLAGKGRTGTMLACYLVWRGAGAEEAIRIVREKRPNSIETVSQEQAIYQFERSLARHAGNRKGSTPADSLS